MQATFQGDSCYLQINLSSSSLNCHRNHVNICNIIKLKGLVCNFTLICQYLHVELSTTKFINKQPLFYLYLFSKSSLLYISNNTGLTWGSIMWLPYPLKGGSLLPIFLRVFYIQRLHSSKSSQVIACLLLWKWKVFAMKCGIILRMVLWH